MCEGLLWAELWVPQKSPCGLLASAPDLPQAPQHESGPLAVLPVVAPLHTIGIVAELRSGHQPAAGIWVVRAQVHSLAGVLPVEIALPRLIPQHVCARHAVHIEAVCQAVAAEFLAIWEQQVSSPVQAVGMLAPEAECWRIHP